MSSPRSRRPFVSLRSTSRFTQLYASGVRGRAGGLAVIRGPGRQRAPEVGVVAGRRVGNAVQRNRVKRRLREAAARVPLQPNTAYIVIADNQVLAAPFATLVEWLRRAVDGATRMQEEDG